MESEKNDLEPPRNPRINERGDMPSLLGSQVRVPPVTFGRRRVGLRCLAEIPRDYSPAHHKPPPREYRLGKPYKVHTF